MSQTLEAEFPTCVVGGCTREVEYQTNGTLSRYCNIAHKRLFQTATAISRRSYAPSGRDLHSDAIQVAELWDRSIAPHRDAWLEPEDFTALMKLFRLYVRGDRTAAN